MVLSSMWDSDYKSVHLNSKLNMTNYQKYHHLQTPLSIASYQTIDLQGSQHMPLHLQQFRIWQKSYHTVRIVVVVIVKVSFPYPLVIFSFSFYTYFISSSKKIRECVCWKDKTKERYVYVMEQITLNRVYSVGWSWLKVEVLCDEWMGCGVVMMVIIS